MKIKNKWQSFVFCRKFLHNCADRIQFKHVNFESSLLPPRWRHFPILGRLESSIKSVLDIKKFQKLGSLGGVTRQVGLEIQPNLVCNFYLLRLYYLIQFWWLFTVHKLVFSSNQSIRFYDQCQCQVTISIFSEKEIPEFLSLIHLKIHQFSLFVDSIIFTKMMIL